MATFYQKIAILMKEFEDLDMKPEKDITKADA